MLLSFGERKRPPAAEAAPAAGWAADPAATAPSPATRPEPPPTIAATSPARPDAAAAATVPATQGAGPDDARVRAAFAAVSAALERPGIYRSPDVYVVTIPRDDLLVSIEGMPVPTAAGLESTFWFYDCPCGKTNVVGQLCVLDHELNDVIDALRAAKVEVASVGAMVLHARRAPLLVRFHAEGQPEPIAKAIREALRSTGKERNAGTPVLPGRAEP